MTKSNSFPAAAPANQDGNVSPVSAESPTEPPTHTGRFVNTYLEARKTTERYQREIAEAEARRLGARLAQETEHEQAALDEETAAATDRPIAFHCAALKLQLADLKCHGLLSEKGEKLLALLAEAELQEVRDEEATTPTLPGAPSAEPPTGSLAATAADGGEDERRRKEHEALLQKHKKDMAAANKKAAARERRTKKRIEEARTWTEWAKAETLLLDQQTELQQAELQKYPDEKAVLTDDLLAELKAELKAEVEAEMETGMSTLRKELQEVRDEKATLASDLVAVRTKANRLEEEIKKLRAAVAAGATTADADADARGE